MSLGVRVCVGGDTHTHLDTPRCSISLYGGRTGNLIRGLSLDKAGVLVAFTDAKGAMHHLTL